MSVMNRIVTEAATYMAGRLALEFKDKITDAGPRRPWVKGETDWYFAGTVVEYLTFCDKSAFKVQLERAIAPIIHDLRAALAQNPASFLTFYSLANQTFEENPGLFRESDFAAEYNDGKVVCATKAAYHDRVKRLFLNVQVTPCYVRDSNMLILPAAQAEEPL